MKSSDEQKVLLRLVRTQQRGLSKACCRGGEAVEMFDTLYELDSPNHSHEVISSLLKLNSKVEQELLQRWWGS